MRHDLFEFNAADMTLLAKTWRVILLLALIAVAVLDLFFWRP